MKKLAFLIHDLMGGGAEKVLVNMVNNLNPEKYDITVVTLFDEGIHRENLAPHIHYKSFLKKSFNGNKYFFRILTPEFWYKRVFGSDEYDIVVSYLEGTCARVAAGCKNSKKIVWIHSTQQEKKYSECFKSKAEADKLYSSFDKIIFVAQSLKEHFAQFCSAFENAKVLYNVNETDKIVFLSQEETDRKELFEDSVPNIAFMGKITENKGVMRLAKIHIKLKEKGVSHRFLVMGTGAQEEEIKKLLEDGGAQDNFVFLGFQKNPYKYLARSDMFVCASYSEGFSTATTEALVLGVPVVVTDCSGMKEMLGDNEYGIITENSDDALYEGIEKMLTDNELRLNYKKQAELRGKDFSMERSLEKIEEFFDTL